MFLDAKEENGSGWLIDDHFGDFFQNQWNRNVDKLSHCWSSHKVLWCGLHYLNVSFLGSEEQEDKRCAQRCGPAGWAGITNGLGWATSKICSPMRFRANSCGIIYVTSTPSIEGTEVSNICSTFPCCKRHASWPSMLSTKCCWRCGQDRRGISTFKNSLRRVSIDDLIHCLFSHALLAEPETQFPAGCPP